VMKVLGPDLIELVRERVRPPAPVDIPHRRITRPVGTATVCAAATHNTAVTEMSYRQTFYPLG